MSISDHRPLIHTAFTGRHVVLPLLLGGFLYLAFRSRTLIMFSWSESLYLWPLLEMMRETTLPLAHDLPAWVVYSLPNALWAYALTAWLTLLWAHQKTPWKWPFLLAGPLLSVGVEIGQRIGWISGTFCLGDLSLAVLACMLGVVIGLRSAHSEQTAVV